MRRLRSSELNVLAELTSAADTALRGTRKSFGSSEKFEKKCGKMAVNGPSRHFYEFGPFRVDERERQLLRGAEVVPLTPKLFDILLVLVSHSGHILEKDELLKAVWPDAVVDEGNLTRNISTLRKALGESQYIETVPWRGYRFVAGVREEQEASPTAESDELWQGAPEKALAVSSGTKREAKWRLSPRALAASLLLIGLASPAIYSWLSNKPKGAETASGMRSMAVLPFKSLGAATGDEYLGLGLADALITSLGNIRQIIVRPTSALRKYTAPGQDPLAAGRELGVDAVLDGHLQREGERIRVTVQLLSVRDNAPLWSGKFETNFTDVFALQDAISEQVTRALTLKLGGEEQARLNKRYTENIEAYQLYLKGRYFWNKRSEEGIKQGIEYFQQAIDKDPDYALAYSGLADSYSALGFSFDVSALPPKEVMPKARAAAVRALEIDDTLAEAHTSLAMIKLLFDWDWPGAEGEFKRAIELNPNYAHAHHWYSHFLVPTGQIERSLAESRRALELAPLDLIINVHLGWHYLYADEPDLARDQLKKTIDMDRNYGLAHRYLGLAYERKAMYSEAIAELRRAIALAGGTTETEAELAYTYAVSGKRSEAQKILDELKGRSKQHYVSPYFMAMIHAGLGENDEALKRLEEAYEERFDLLVYLKVEPKLNSLRSDQRFTNLMRRVGLTP